MILPVYFILFFGLLRLCIAFVNLISGVYLPRRVHLSHKPLVSILIPARNEEDKIGELLENIGNLTYVDHEVIVYNDLSTDNTADIINEQIAKNKKISIIQGKKPEEGWLGKNYACHQLAQHAVGEYFLFLDADVMIKNNLIEKAVYLMDKQKLGLLSIFPNQVIRHTGVLFSIPLMNWILLSLLPLVLVRVSNKVSLAAANGQFMFFKADMYRKIYPHEVCRNNRVEDIAICKLYKKNHIRVSTILGNNDIQCVMYNSLKESIAGFSKNIFAFFGNSVLITCCFACVTTLAPFYLLYLSDIGLFAIYIAFIILNRIFISIASHQNALYNVLSIPVQQIVFLLIIQSAYFNQKNQTLTWKGRNITT